MKDRLTPMAIGAGLACIFLAMIMDGSSPIVLFKPSSLILVFGGTTAVSVAGLLKRDVKDLKPILKQAIGKKTTDFQTTIDTLYELAKFSKAKPENLRDLPSKVRELCDDPFLLRGCEMIADSKGAEEIRETMEDELNAMQERHQKGTKFFTDMGGFAPTIGILGTVIGLIHVLGGLSNPNSLGPGIAAAFTATLWGVLSANVMWLPIANKLQRISDLESQVKNIQIEGVIGILSGMTSRALKARMEAYLPASDRQKASRVASQGSDEEVAA